MANEAPPEEILTITEFPALDEYIASFCENETYSDVTFIVEGRKLYAHKIVLAARSKFFRNLFGNDPQQSNFDLTNTPVEAFRKVLKYIYTGSIAVGSSDGDLIFDILKLAHEYSLQKVTTAMNEKMTSILDMTNVFTILNKANNCEMDELRQLCHNFIDENLSEILETERINVLTAKSMIKLLERDSFGLPEIDIFHIVEKWCKCNSVNASIIQCVRLINLSSEEILNIVWPSKLIEDAKLLSVLKEFTTGTSKLNKRKIKPPLVKDRNILTLEKGMKVITGMNAPMLLTNQENVTNWTYHTIDDATGITVDLNLPYQLNHIKMTLYDNFYRYYIQVSLDQKTWHNIIDHREYNCRSHQNLYFEETVARYIRIVGTYSSKNKNFAIANLEMFYKNEIPKLVNGIVCPVSNVAAANMGAYIHTLMYDWKCLWETIYGGVYLKIKTMTIHLAQPYMIGTMRVKFTNMPKDTCKYSIYIKSNAFLPCFTTIEENKDIVNETIFFKFEMKCISYIEISCQTKLSGTSFDPTISIECPSEG